MFILLSIFFAVFFLLLLTFLPLVLLLRPFSSFSFSTSSFSLVFLVLLCHPSPLAHPSLLLACDRPVHLLSSCSSPSFLRIALLFVVTQHTVFVLLHISSLLTIYSRPFLPPHTPIPPHLRVSESWALTFSQSLRLTLRLFRTTCDALHC